MKITGIISLIIIMHWGVNLYQGLNCDFEAPYKCEAIGAIGVFIPPASLVTVYVDKGE